MRISPLGHPLTFVLSPKGARKKNDIDSYLFNMAIDPSPNGIYNGRSLPREIIQNPFSSSS